MDVGTLAKSRYVSLTTFRRDGTPVATPVWVAQQGDELVVYTASSSGKAKRLRNSSRVLLAPCDMRGRVTGDVVVGIARLQDEAETAVTISLIQQRYGLQARFPLWWDGRRAGGRLGGADVGIAIRLGVGCTVTTDVRGDIAGAQANAGEAAFKGTTSVLIAATVQGCERTGANIQATPRQSLSHVPWTASGGETDLKGKISFPANAEISPGTAWAFEVRTPQGKRVPSGG